jgi:glutamate synthase (NADPH) large chain
VPGASGADDPRVQDAVRKLILTEDFFVMQRVLRTLRETLERFEDAELATLIATKRIDDYKRSLALRNVRGIDAPGTYGWILHQQRRNAGRWEGARFDELLATAAMGDLADAMIREGASA